MTSPIDMLNAAAGTWWTYVFHAAWQGALVGGILLAVNLLGRRWPGPLRYGLLALALLKFAVPPLLPMPTGVFSVAGPRLPERETLPLEAESRSPAAIAPVQFTSPNFTAPIQQTLDVSFLAEPTGSNPPGPASQMRGRTRSTLHWKAALMIGHGVGSLAFLIWIAWQVVRLSQAARRARPVTAGNLQEQFAELAGQLGVRRRPRLMLSGEVHTPIAFGLLRPTVMLPVAVVEKLPLSEVRVILAHELAHYKRGDLWVNWLQLLLLAAWWFHPVLWVLNRALRQVREECCDDLLLSRGFTSNDAYCDILVRAAAELSGKPPLGATLGFAEHLHPLGRRVARIMDRTIRRCHKMSALGILVLLVVGGLLLPGLKSQQNKPTAESSQPMIGTEENPLSSIPAMSRTAELFWKLRPYREHSSRAQAKLLDEFLHLQPSAVPFLIEQLQHHSKKGAIAGASDRVKAACLLGKFDPPAKEAISALIGALQDEWVAEFAARTLGDIGSPAKEAVPALIKALESKVDGAPRALTRIAPDSSEVAVALVDAFDGKTQANRKAQQQRYALAEALGDLKAGKPRVEAALLGGLDDKDRSVRKACALALNRLGSRNEKALAGWQNEVVASRQVQVTNDTLPELIQKLRKSASRQEQGAALSQLRKLGPEGIEAVPALIEVMKNPKSWMRFQAAHVLGVMAPAATDAVPALIEAVRDDDLRLSQSAALALGEFGSAARVAVPVLLEALQWTDPRLRLNAARSLWRVDPAQTQNTVSVLTGLLAKPPRVFGGDTLILIPIYRALREIGPPANEALPLLVQAFETRTDRERWEAAAAVCLIDPGQTSKLVPLMIRALEDRTELNRASVAQCLGEIGAPAKAALPALSAVSNEDDPTLRESAARAIKKIQGEGKPQAAAPAPKSPTELFKQLKVFQNGQKRSQAKLLDEFLRMEPSVVPFLIQQLQIKTRRDTAEAVEGRRKAAWLLSELGAAAKPAMQALVNALEDRDESVAQEAAKALGAIGPDANEAIPALIEAVKFKTQNAARSLASIAPGEPRVATAVIDAFEDRAYPSRDQLLYVMSDLKTENKRLEAVLLAAHEGGNKEFRSTSAYALYRIGANSKEALAAIRAWQTENTPLSDPGNVSVPALIEKLRKPKDRMDDLNALQQLNRFGPQAAAAVPALIEYLNGPIARYRSEAARVLAAIGPAAKDAVPALIALLQNTKDFGRLSAVSALGEIGPAAKDAVPALIDALKEDDRGVSGNAPRALGLIGPAAKAAIPLLEQALQDSDRRFRMQAAASIWRIDPAFIKVSVPIMIEAIENPPRDSGNPSFYLSKTLGDIGPQAKDALPTLRRVFDRPDDFGRWMAGSALCRIDPTQSGAILAQMIQALEDPANTSRGWVVFGLSEMGALAVSAVPALTAAMSDDDPNLSGAAARSLEKIASVVKR